MHFHATKVNARLCIVPECNICHLEFLLILERSKILYAFSCAKMEIAYGVRTTANFDRRFMIAQVTATKLHSLLVCGDPDDDLAPRAARFEILDGVDRRRESIEGAIDHRADATVIDQVLSSPSLSGFLQARTEKEC